MKDAVTLGIETSCDETSVAVIRGGKIASNVVASSMHLHKRYGGVVPEIATRHHVEVINYVAKEALNKAAADLGQVDLIAVTQGPGLIGALLTGISYAKALSYSLGVPLVGTNHVISHLWANFLMEDKPKLPFMGLVVSGGHTILIRVADPGKYEIVGQTRDDAVGEAFDKVAKVLNLGYPGGPEIEKKAARASAGGIVKFPLPQINGDSLDFSFSGIKTAVLYYVRDKGGVSKLSGRQAAGIAAGFQDAVCDVVARKAVAACAEKGIKQLAVGGGVSANSVLRKKLASEAAMRGIKVFIPPMELCLDNGAMTAALGRALFNRGVKPDPYMSGYANFS